MKRIVVVGAGGFAREVRWLAEQITRHTSPGEGFEFVGYVVSDPSRLTELDSKDQVLGDLDWLTSNRDRFDSLALGIGTPGPRLKLAEQLEPSFGPEHWPALVHPTAIWDEQSCRASHGTIVCAGVIGTVNVVLEPYAMVNLSCTLGHESTIGRGAVLNPTVNISGGVTIGAGVLVGTGAQVLQYVRVEERAVVGAGAVVTKSVAAGDTVVGMPAKPLKRS